MSAMQIAPQGTFPKQLPEFVKFFAVVFDAAGKFETDAFFERQFHLLVFLVPFGCWLFGLLFEREIVRGGE